MLKQAGSGCGVTVTSTLNALAYGHLLCRQATKPAEAQLLAVYVNPSLYEICRDDPHTASGAVLTQGATGALGTAQLWMGTLAATPQTGSQPRLPGAAPHQLAATRAHPARLSVTAAGGVPPTRQALPGLSQNSPLCNPGDRCSRSQHVTPAQHQVDPATNASPSCCVEVHRWCCCVRSATVSYLITPSSFSEPKPAHVCQVYITLDLGPIKPAQCSLLSSLHPLSGQCPSFVWDARPGKPAKTWSVNLVKYMNQASPLAAHIWYCKTVSWWLRLMWCRATVSAQNSAPMVLRLIELGVS